MSVPYDTTFTFNDGITSSTSTVSDKTISSASYGGDDNKSKLVSVVIGTSCTKFSSEAFYNCTSLTSITIPNSVESIPYAGFKECTSLDNVTIPDSVKQIYGEAFESCTSLATVIIGNSVEIIYNRAFSKCTSLDNVTIPNSVATIHYSTFNECTSLRIIDLGSVNNIGVKLFEGCTSLNNVTIPNSLTTISDQAFSNCTSLTSITIPNSVNNIGDEAFSDCTLLPSITIPNSVITIPYAAFVRCTSLDNVTIPNGVTSIGASAFSGCTSLTSITIPNSVTTIGDEAFSNCTSLDNFTIPNGVTSIGASAFANSSNLTTVNIPDSVTTIGNSAFQPCINLTKIDVNSSNQYYSNNNNDGVLYNKGVTTLIQYPSKKSDTVFYTPSSVTNIDSDAFANSSILTTVTIPDGAISIGNNAFSSCISLVRIVFRGSTSTMSIGTNLFSGVSENNTRQIIFYDAIFYNTTENDIQSSLLSQVQTITTDDTVYFYNDSTATAQIFIYPRTNPISNICFPAGTPITCNQGNIPIEKINPDIHTIRNKKIVGITKTVTQDKYLVCFKKDALGTNIPSQKTIISNNHRIFYQGNMIKAEKFIGINDKVYKIKYRNEILYNVLMEEHDKMVVNNLICETLNPENGTAKLYKYLQKFNPDEVNDLINIYNEYVIKNKIYSSKK
jgi:hypothetical protein